MVKKLGAGNCNFPTDSCKFLTAKLDFKSIKGFHFHSFSLWKSLSLDFLEKCRPVKQKIKNNADESSGFRRW